MGLRKKKRNINIKRACKSGRVYFCRHCGYYTAANLYKKGDRFRSISNPDLTVKATGRTCNDCRRRP